MYVPSVRRSLQLKRLQQKVQDLMIVLSVELNTLFSKLEGLEGYLNDRIGNPGGIPGSHRMPPESIGILTR